MATAIEAESFSIVNELAAHPPAHLKDVHHHHQHEALTLYIVRVPGSRDVFLTPLKPRDRVVTAEDVASSLYYVHINTSNDVDLLHQADEALSNDETGRQSFTTSHDLKYETSPTPPMLPSRHSHYPKNPLLPPKHLQPSNHNEGAPALPARPKKILRKPVMTDITNLHQQEGLQLTLPALPPRPLPPLPDENALSTSGSSTASHHAGTHYDDKSLSLPLSPAEALRHEALEGSLTLIRREPSTSSQCNVATIRDVSMQTPSFAARNTSPSVTRRIQKNGAPLDIVVTNPAYLSFSTQNRPLDQDQADRTTFRRMLHMSASGSFDHTSSRCQADSPIQSRNSMSSDRSAELFSQGHNRARQSLDMRTRGYTFKSLWDGDCEFITSASGRSLICRHAETGQSTNEISELRFNLPITTNGPSTAPSSEHRRQSYISSNKRHSRLDILRKRGTQSINDPSLGVDYDLEGIPDLSLGQEMAGGGFGGRQPKLGKLIVHPFGLAMLDLLVAANIGLWWRAWEKVNK